MRKPTGLWTKTRIKPAQEFVIGRYIPSHLGINSIVVGFYEGQDLHYAACGRARFIPATRRPVFDAIKHLQSARCPFVNLPQKEVGRWGEGFTSEKMKRRCGPTLELLRSSNFWNSQAIISAMGNSPAYAMIRTHGKPFGKLERRRHLGEWWNLREVFVEIHTQSSIFPVARLHLMSTVMWFRTTQ